MIRESFWNLYVPGCAEHYLAHTIRTHSDFIPELDLVLEKDGQIIGNVMYTKAKLTDEQGNEKTILTFGPVCIRPQFQRLGYSKLLLEKSFTIAKQLNYEAIVIFGMPSNYVSRGFEGCYKYHVSMDETYYTAMLVKELVPKILEDHTWSYQESPALEIDLSLVEEYDRKFPPLKKLWQASQEEFDIISKSIIKS
ncbi:GNAT family N-acetyltransferase [Companilactobacillus baiquanensis]|uniref:GNAT family N-acetyltransferase n=1 Tax=Companilactobacillus baiquanensis TaxID=2486005 RepID=A0ABW1USD2_9LACO|nr:GNAT family N-acetyltransferase [Companilactobacillus baiquanensis]